MPASPPRDRLLVDPAWLAAQLGAPDLRVYDCNTILAPDPVTTYRVESGRPGWAAGHIPGAGFIDNQEDLSVTPHRYRFMLLPPDDYARNVGRLGIGDGKRVVLYSSGHMMWATRAWATLFAYGFEAMVLDGGLARWKAEGRPVTTEPVSYPPATFTPRPRPGFMLGRDDVSAAIGRADTVLVNALAREQFLGTGGTAFGRQGRIPGSVSAPYPEIVDPATNTYAGWDAIARLYAGAGVARDKRVLNYCGGGISATLNVFAQHAMGYDNIALYDASMQEWALDESLPMERG